MDLGPSNAWARIVESYNKNVAFQLPGIAHACHWPLAFDDLLMCVFRNTFLDIYSFILFYTSL